VPVTSTVKPGTTRRTSNAPRGTSPAPLGTKQNQSRPRRERGDHGISWDKINKCYVGTISLGHDSAGKRVRPTVRGKTKADVKAKLDALGDEIKAGIRTPATYTVRQCVADWLDSLTLDADTIASYRGQAEKWIYPRIGARKLKDLTATDLDDFFRNIGSALGKRSMVMIKSTLRRSIRRAQKHDLIGRNVAELADLPQGQPGRPSRAMTETEAAKVLTAATGKPAGYTTVIKIGTSAQAATHAATDTGELACGNRPRPDRTLIQISTDLADTTCRACRTQLGIDQSHDEQGRLAALFVLAITLGLRPGELRALRWDHVDLDKGVIYVWRSARRDGDTKTPRSRRSLILPRRALSALRTHRSRQAAERLVAGETWQDHGLVFCHEDGQPYTRDALNWRFAKVTRLAGLGHWHAHEARHTAVSIMSSNGVPIQDITDTVGHKSTHVTETVYRHVIVPAIRGGATVMDDVFGAAEA
jgi:integrase